MFVLCLISIRYLKICFHGSILLLFILLLEWNVIEFDSNCTWLNESILINIINVEIIG